MNGMLLRFYVHENRRRQRVLRYDELPAEERVAVSFVRIPVEFGTIDG